MFNEYLLCVRYFRKIDNGGDFKKKKRKVGYGHTVFELKILMAVNDVSICKKRMGLQTA